MRVSIKVASVLAVLLGILLGVLGAGGLFEAFDLGQQERSYVIYAAVTVTALLGVSILATILIYVSAVLGNLADGGSRWRRPPIFTHRPARASEVPEIAAMASDVFGQMSTSLDQSERLFGLDREMFSIVKDGNSKTQGYFCIFRLTKAGASAVFRNDFAIANLPVEYIRQDRKRQDCDVYIGAVYGRSRAARGYVLGAVEGTLRAMRPHRVFARAATPDGMRVLSSKGFEPIGPRPPAIGDLFVWTRADIGLP